MESSGGRDVARLISGATVAQIIIVLATPVITRLYSPSDLGLLGVFVSISGTLGVVACLRYDLAIMLPESDEDSMHLLMSSCVIAVGLCMMLIVSLWLLRERVFNLLHVQLHPIWTSLLPVAVLMIGVANALTTWQSREKQFERLAIGRVIRAAVLVGTQIALRWEGLAFSGGTALITGQILADAILVVVLAGGITKLFQTRMKLKGFAHFKELLRRYKKFPFFSVWGALFNRTAAYVPQVLLAIFCNLEVVGFVLISQKLVGMPVSIVGEGVGRVFYQKASEYRNEEEAVHVLLSILVIGLFSLATVVLGGVFIVAPYAILPLLGPEWDKVGTYIQILIPMYIMKFSASPVSQVALVYEKQERFLLWQGAFIVVSAVSIVVGTFLRDAPGALMGYSITGVLMYAYLIALCFKWAGAKPMKILGYAKAGLSNIPKSA